VLGRAPPPDRGIPQGPHIKSWNHPATFLFPRPREDFIAQGKRVSTADPRALHFGKRPAGIRGRGILALSDDKHTKRKAGGPSSRDSSGGSADRDVGHALRTVYSETVSEDIPPELLDLLGKLK
jgi:hypothetical protein